MKLKIATLAIGMLVLSAAPSAAQWTGCGIGVGAGVFNGNAYDGSPIGISTQGQKADAVVFCDYRMQAFVLGAGVSYGTFFGDAKDLGISSDLTVYGRLGVLTSPANLLYAHGGWTDVKYDFGNTWTGHSTGYKMGIGDEFRIPNSPIYLDLRYSYTQLNPDAFLPPNYNGAANFKVNSNEFRVGLNLKFGPGMFGNSGPMFESGVEHAAPVVCDPKLANCKK